MSLYVVVKCDGHRHQQPCRGALNVRTTSHGSALAAAHNTRWRRHPVGMLCPSKGHDEDQP